MLLKDNFLHSHVSIYTYTTHPRTIFANQSENGCVTIKLVLVMVMHGMMVMKSGGGNIMVVVADIEKMNDQSGLKCSW